MQGQTEDTVFCTLNYDMSWYQLFVSCSPTSSLSFHPLQASILDLHSGALSMGQQFVNIYR